MTSLSILFATVFLYIRLRLKIAINDITIYILLETVFLYIRLRLKIAINDITIYILLETVFLGQGRYILQNCSREFFPAIA